MLLYVHPLFPCSVSIPLHVLLRGNSSFNQQLFTWSSPHINWNAMYLNNSISIVTSLGILDGRPGSLSLRIHFSIEIRGSQLWERRIHRCNTRSRMANLHTHHIHTRTYTPRYTHPDIHTQTYTPRHIYPDTHTQIYRPRHTHLRKTLSTRANTVGLIPGSRCIDW